MFLLKEPNILKQLTDESYKDDQRDFYRSFFNIAFFEKDKDNVLKPTQKEEINFKEKRKRYLYCFDNTPVKQKEKIARMAEYIINGKITDNYDDLEILKQKFKDKYNDNLDVMYNNIVRIDKSKLHMKYDRGVFKFLLKFIAAYEKVINSKEENK